MATLEEARILKKCAERVNAAWSIYEQQCEEAERRRKLAGQAAVEWAWHERNRALAALHDDTA